MAEPVQFLGVDLAWKATNRSGVVLLAGPRFPLSIHEAPRSLGSHDEVLEWIGGHVRDRPSAVGVDAPLLGLTDPPRPRACDKEITSLFHRFHAGTYPPPSYPGLRAFSQTLVATYGQPSFSPRAGLEGGRPAIREVYPNALQVLIFALHARPGVTIVKYKRRHFRTNREWALKGLRPFTDRCAESIGGRWVDDTTPAWRALRADRPIAEMSGAELKSIEDRWDAVLCALAVALERLSPASVRLYPETGWRNGAILAPVLRAQPESL